MKIEVFLAQASPAAPSSPKQDVPRPGSLQQPPPAPQLWTPFRNQFGQGSEVMIVLIVVLSFAVILFGGALLFRRPSGRTLAGRRGVASPEGSGSRKRRRRSRSGTEERRAPTLKERGGLPPIREEGQDSPTSPT